MSTNNRKKSARNLTYSKASGRDRQSGRAGQNARRSAAQRARRNTKKRKPSYDYDSYDYKMIAIVGVVLILVIAGAVLLTRHFKSKPVAETSTEETELQKDVTVDGISITGMSKDVARDTILEHFAWDMKVTYDGAEEPYQVPNLMETKVNALLEEIFNGDPKESYNLDTGGLDEEVKAQAAAVAAKWDVKAVNGAIAGFDKETGNFIYTPEKVGVVIDQTKLADDISNALTSKNFKATLTAMATQVQPEITEAQAKELYKVIGTMTTTTTSNKDRNTNIQLAADALNGMIIQPGEEFSFNNTTGNRTLEKGYRPAGAYVNGVLVEEPGGGVCQVSSTLYNAVVFSGLTTTERHAHSYEPSYVTPGEDAMVSYDGYAGPDMKFVNNSKDAVAIRTKFENQKLTISIVGIQILEDGEKLYMKSEKIAVLDPPEPVYEENQSLQLDEEKVVKAAVNGSRWNTNLVKEKDGQVISDEFFHKSTYKGKAATIQRNTSGVVIPESTTATQPAESAPSTEVTTTAPEGPGETTTQAATQAPETTTTQSAGPVATTAPTTQAPAPSEPATQASLPPSPGGGGMTETVGANPFSS